MQGLLNQLLQFIQNGVAAVFRFIAQIWAWAIGEIIRVLNVPFTSLSVWKWVVIVATIAGAGWFFYKAGKHLWDTFYKLLVAFADAVRALVVSLPNAVIGGLIILAGLWVMGKIP